jgi:hypothetical protein
MNGSGPHVDTEQYGSERKELEAVLESGIFAPNSNAARLLRFVCERHFRSPAEPVTEYDVGVDALGRRSTFDPQRDSIVRVEAHRVRKRLHEYYENEGADHPVKIVLARGQYAPQFVRAEPLPDAPAPPTGRLRTRGWILLAAVVILSVGLAAGISRLTPASRQSASKPKPLVTIAGSDTVRILAGLSSGEFVDRFGTHWSADQFFSGGTTTEARYVALAMADDPGIYRRTRTGEDFTYDIPLQAGVYELRLMFAESASTPILGTVGNGVRAFHVDANGVQIIPPRDGRHMQQMDVVADAGGTDIADIKVVKDISPAADGKLHLRFAGRGQRAFVNAIEIVPGLNGRMRPLRWRANDAPYTDREGHLWLADHYYHGGRLSRFRATVANTAEPGLYEGERFGSFTYSVPVAAGTTYTVQLHFAENYFGGYAATLPHPRIFSVFANHAQVLRDFDVTRDAGAPVKALVKTLRGVKPNSFDKIVLSFEPSTEFAIVNAISVEDEAKPL